MQEKLLKGYYKAPKNGFVMPKSAPEMESQIRKTGFAIPKMATRMELQIQKTGFVIPKIAAIMESQIQKTGFVIPLKDLEARWQDLSADEQSSSV